MRQQPEGAVEKTKGWIMVRRIGGKNGLLGKTVGYANSNQPWKLNVIPLYSGLSNLASGQRKSPATLSICAGYFFVFQILLTDNSVSPM